MPGAAVSDVFIFIYKYYVYMLKSLFIAFFLSFPFFIKGEAQTTEQSKSSGLKKCTVFTAGDDNVNSYRIPSLLTAKDGTLLVFCEARRDSWRDKSRRIL